ncbi:hypothetical protein CSUI_008732 [Cystoisospora suis]|uniref:Uncharacterized protein n=1 Tax=Cystoisospora suis TaxID=483139 RepID=A0A2C6KM30_9APIC|nr:hypothetical protein CSUI_008732 [Cystoisospora suis]
MGERRLLGFAHGWQAAFLFLVGGPVCFFCLPVCGVGCWCCCCFVCSPLLLLSV